jgi:hypothetical protein
MVGECPSPDSRLLGRVDEGVTEVPPSGTVPNPGIQELDVGDANRVEIICWTHLLALLQC